MAGQREIELKFDIHPDAVDLLRAHPLLGGRDAIPGCTHSVYHDTPKGKLRRAGVTLRVRRVGDGGYLQTIKADAAGAGLFNRDEWEALVDGPAPDLALAVGTAAEQVLAKPKTVAALTPVFESIVERSRWDVAVGGAAIELILDMGEVVDGDRREAVAEIELELKSGPPSALFEAARALVEAVPLRLGVLTKSERGYRLLAGDADRIAKAGSVALDHAMTAGAAFAVVAASCVRHFRLNEAGVLAGDAAALHQARVALRRLRSAMSIFRPVLTDARGEILRTAFASVAATLGEARDLDVFIGGQREVAGALHGERARVYRHAAERLDAPAFRALMLELVEWATHGEWRDAPGAARPITDFADDALDRLWRRVRRRGADLAELDDDARHELRIAGKKLRYACDFFAALYDGRKRSKRRGKFVTALERLQGDLGTLNDQVTGRVLTQRLAERLGIDVAVAEADDARRRHLLASAEAAHRKLVKAGRFWR